MKEFIHIFLFFALSAQLLYAESKEAAYYRSVNEEIVQCLLCPRKCTLGEGQKGYCSARKNIKGKLFSIVYGNPVSISNDPIVKKPVFHCLPGSNSFSLATAGCNLRCVHCQNWQISQADPEKTPSYRLSPEEIVNLALEKKCDSISYTYTEPVIYYEYMLDIAKLARQKGLKNIMVTAGYINPEPLKELCQWIDVYRIDLKGFSNAFYQKIAGADLEPVLTGIKTAKESGVWIEIVNLVIPELNDSEKEIREMCRWIKTNLGENVPIHFSRFHPQHKLMTIPMTPIATLEKARKIAKEAGLKFVYIGNVPGSDAENTFCPKCEKIVIKRSGYFVTENNLKNGKCKFCGEKIPGIWN